MEYEQLKLDRQICFPLYAASRLITKEYQPYLDKLGITYTQYLVLLILWETDNLTVNEISKRLLLNTNTVTPLLKRLEKMGIVERNRSKEDERKVHISLTKKGIEMKDDASDIPFKLSSCFINSEFDIESIKRLQEDLYSIINLLSNKREKMEE